MHLSFPYPLTNGVVKTICERYIDETRHKELKTKEFITLYLFYRYNNLLHYKKLGIERNCMYNKKTYIKYVICIITVSPI